MKTLVPAGISFLVSILAMGFVLSLENPRDDGSGTNSAAIPVENPDPATLVSPEGMTWLPGSGSHPGVWISRMPVTQSELNQALGHSDVVLVISAPSEPARVTAEVARKYCQTTGRRLPNQSQLRQFCHLTGQSHSEVCADQTVTNPQLLPFRTVMTQAEWRNKLRDEDARDPVLAALR